MEKDNLYRFDQYLRNELSDKERLEFKQELEQDSILKKEFETYKILVEGIKDSARQANLEKIIKIQSEFLSTQDEKKSKVKIINKKKISNKRTVNFNSSLQILVAASLISIITFFFLFRTDNNSKTFNQLLETHISTDENFSSRNISSDNNTNKEVAKKLFAEKKYVECIPFFNKTIEEDSSDMEIQLFLGISNLKINRIKQGIEHLNTISKKHTSLYPIARWYLALSYLKNKNYTKGKSILIEICKDDNNDFYKEALELLKYLNNDKKAKNLINRFDSTPVIQTSFNNNHDTLLAKKYFSKALSFVDSSYFDSASYYYLKAAPIFEKNKNWVFYIKCYNQAGESCRNANKYKLGLDYLNKALKKGKEKFGENHELVASTYNNTGLIYSDIGENDAAIMNHKKALKIRKSIFGSNNYLVADSYNNIGLVYYYEGDFNKALNELEKSLEIKRSYYDKNNIQIAYSLSNLSLVYRDLNLLEKSIEFALKAHKIKVLNKGKTHFSNAYSLHNLGILYNYQGKYEESLEYFKESLILLKEHFSENHPYIAQSLIAIGNTYADQGKYEKAVIEYNKALKIQKKSLPINHPDFYYSYQNIATIFLEQNKFSHALDYFKKAMLYTNNNSKLIADLYAQIGLSKAGLKKYAEAFQSYNNSVSELKKIDSEYSVSAGFTYYYQAKAHNDMGNYSLSLENINKSLKCFFPSFKAQNISENPSQFPNSNISTALEVLAFKATILKNYYLNNSKRIGDLNNSLSTYELVDNFIDSSRYFLIDRQDRQNVLRKSISTYENLIKLYFLKYKKKRNLKYLEKAFKYSEKTKSQLLQEHISNDYSLKFANVPQKKIENEIILKTEITNIQNSIINLKSGSKEYNKNQKDLIDIKHSYRNFILDLQQEYPDYYKLKYGFKLISPSEIQLELKDKNATLVEFFVEENSIYIFALNHLDQKLLKIQRDSIFDLKLMNTLQSISNINSNAKEFENNAYFLYKKLIEPVDSLIKGKDLIIIPDGKLSYLPFEVLVNEKNKYEVINWKQLNYIQKKYNISYAFSSTLLFEKRFRKKSRKKSNLIAFAPKFISKNIREEKLINRRVIRDSVNTPPLPGAEKEVTSIKKYINSKTYFNDDASESNFKLNAPKFGIIHIATHTIIDEEQPLYSCMLFNSATDTTEDQSLYAYELFNIHLDADLAVLSSCKTGYGKIQRGEGIGSLARAFAYAGCPSIVTTLWDVKDAQTPKIIESFYKGLAMGMEKNEAMHYSKSEYLKNCSNSKAHPVYWSNLIVLGNTSSLFIQPPVSYFKIVIYISIILIFIFIFWRYLKMN